MSKLDCDVVKDLTPSYLEEICSAGSRQLVEEHVAECEKCRNYIQMMRQTELVSKKAEQGEIDYMKKVKSHFHRQSGTVAGICLSFLAFFAILWFIAVLAKRGSLWYYYLAYPVLALVSVSLLSKADKRPQGQGLRNVAGVLGVCGLIYSVAIIQYSMFAIEKGYSFFGVEISDMGPALMMQLNLVVVVEFLLFAFFAVQSIKRAERFGILPLISLLGMLLSMTFRETLNNMETLEEHRQICGKILFVFALEGIVVVAAEMLWRRFLLRRGE
ncbi:MAG: zf-HC2 domain-containing protein [Candidatus Gastranaerophilales bacterium]|nr:zf-HC2 domain-containing protein [Candidatus Gastranaerophilales bacterium]